jgi:transcriptional regulator with GAF, ATPase, and Fis domain
VAIPFFSPSEPFRLQLEVKSLHKSLQFKERYRGLIGKTPVMQNFFELIEKVAMADAPVVVTGQSGFGKEWVARAIHTLSPRRQGPFMEVNCAALDENLLESSLFGHVKGAFPGANNPRIGRFEAAHGGTIFLDEIGDIPLTTQIKLLRTLEEKEIERVGASGPIKIDVRIVSATHKNLEELIANGQFREDLYFRINVFPITCPPFCDRMEDIPVITDKVTLEKRAELIRALRQTGGNRSEAARILGISRVTVWKQINKFGIDIPRELAV